jgi:cytochrome c-type biogenesis protein CcmE
MLYSALNDSLVYFILPNEYAREVNQYEGRRIRLGGIVSPDSMNFDEQEVRLNFLISDSLQQYPVRHRGAPPALFQEGVGVVVEGQFVEGVFQSDNLLVRHSEVYEVSDGEIDNVALREALK